MYNYLDFKCDRHRVRDRFMKEVNKKTTIEDIGGLLDRFVLDSKANTQYFQPEHHILEQPKAAMKDTTNNELYWMDTFINQCDPIKPQWIDDQSEFEIMNAVHQDEFEEILDQVKF